jgi:intein/homing endonuclease
MTERIGLMKGKKVYTTLIPDYVLKQSIELINSCIRGIFDTDGTFYLKGNYPCIELNLSNKVLPKQIHKILREQGVTSKLYNNSKRLVIQGKERVTNFYELIGFRNDRHLNKIKKYFHKLQVGSATRCKPCKSPPGLFLL